MTKRGQAEGVDGLYVRDVDCFLQTYKQNVITITIQDGALNTVVRAGSPVLSQEGKRTCASLEKKIDYQSKGSSLSVI